MYSVLVVWPIASVMTLVLLEAIRIFTTRAAVVSVTSCAVLVPMVPPTCTHVRDALSCCFAIEHLQPMQMLMLQAERM